MNYGLVINLDSLETPQTHTKSSRLWLAFRLDVAHQLHYIMFHRTIHRSFGGSHAVSQCLSKFRQSEARNCFIKKQYQNASALLPICISQYSRAYSSTATSIRDLIPKTTWDQEGVVKVVWPDKREIST